MSWAMRSQRRPEATVAEKPAVGRSNQCANESAADQKLVKCQESVRRHQRSVAGRFLQRLEWLH